MIKAKHLLMNNEAWDNNKEINLINFDIGENVEKLLNPETAQE